MRLCIVSTLETKGGMSGLPALWNTVLFISWINEDDT